MMHCEDLGATESFTSRHGGISIESKSRATDSTSALSSVEQNKKNRSSSSNWLKEITYAPVFAPSMEEFADPIHYIRAIEPIASQHGMCKIQIPDKFKSHVNAFPSSLADFSFTTREQKLREHVWEGFGLAAGIIYEHEKPFTLKEFRTKVQEEAEALMKGSTLLPPSVVESEFWRLRNSAESKDVFVLYGNDVEGTACVRDDPHNIGSSGWNLQDLGRASWSLLKHAPMDYPGVTTPMLYIGSLFSTFFWHVEDHWMHSINFSHHGALKTWYGVPASHAEEFEKIVFERVYKRAILALKKQSNDPEFIKKAALKQLLAKNTLFHPKILIDAGIPVYKLDQQPGDFIITFPRAYHSGFSHGFNIGEAVNFALPEWLTVGKVCLEKYCHLQIPQILPHQMLTLKAAASLLDELKGAKRQPDQVERSTIEHFCDFATEHGRLRKHIVEHQCLEEVHLDMPLRSTVCFLCYRHIVGCFVRHRETNGARCMQCSSFASHITSADWDLAVPQVVELIDHVHNQFILHYHNAREKHPVELNVPRKPRSIRHRVSGKKRKFYPPILDPLIEAIEPVLSKKPMIKRAEFGWSEQKDSFSKRSVLRVVRQESILMPEGDMVRTVLEDEDSESYLLGEELLHAINAPIKRPCDIDRILSCFLHASDHSLSLVKRPCALPHSTILMTTVDKVSLMRIMEAVDHTISNLICQFAKDVWIDLPFSTFQMETS